jgi:curved DNA-binding protein CbpA
MGNEQVKIEQEFSYNENLSNIHNIELLSQKKFQLETLYKNKKHVLTTHQIDKIIAILNKINTQINYINDNLQEFNTRPPTSSSNIDLQMAMKLFKLSSYNFTIQDLKTTYKKLALITHPDKFGGDTTKFNLVKTCYLLLEEHLIRMKNDKPHHELKQQYQTQNDFYISKGGDIPINTQNTPILDKDHFNPAVFNKYYEEHKMADPNDTGYGDWFKSQDDTMDMELDKYKGKVSKDKFEQAFTNQKKKLGTQIEVYRGDPMALISCNTGFTSLDGDDIVGDFSKAPEAKNGLGYTDLKTAYSAKGQFIDPNTVEFQTYKNVQEYEKARSNISFTMTPEQREEAQQRKIIEEEHERRRLAKLQERDRAIEQHYYKVHQQMLGYAPKSS